MSGSGHASAASEDPVTESHSEGTSQRKTLPEIQADAESDHSQHSPPGQSVYGKNPQRQISDEEWLNYRKGDPHVGLRSDASIFRVPKFLKDTKNEAYVPQTLSLGPYHHKSAKLAPMDHHKGRALRRMIVRYNRKMNIDPDDILVFANNATDAILNMEDKIRNIYEENIDWDRQNLARMLFLDGCCILEVLRTLGRPPNYSYERNDPYERNDRIFGENKVAASNILKDIVMLENQIPSIVLLELLRLEYPKVGEVENTENMLLDLLAKGTRGLFKTSVTPANSDLKKAMVQVKEFDHVLGFLHKVIVYQCSIDSRPADQGGLCFPIERLIGHLLLMFQDKKKAMNDDFESIPTAVELKIAGIKFRPYNGGINGIRFDRKSSIIYLPVVSITYGTEVLLRNLIAFEMCRPSEPNYVSSYVNLMDDLIDSQKDVALLRSMGILTKLIGSDQEVADLFNGLCKDVGTVSMENVFDELRKDVNAHYKFKIRVQVEDFVQNHCSSPWKVSTLVAASFIACFGLIQTIFTIISVYKK